MHNALDEILQQPGIWRGRQAPQHTGLEHTATGFAELDALLPGGGWPQGALSELLYAQPGIGELRLLMPALARLSRQGRWVALIAPPFIPYAPALAAHGIDLSHVLLVHPKTSVDTLWALEQALKAGTCGAVLAWPKSVDERALRRLQLAAEAGKSWAILFRDLDSAAQSSPASLRMALSVEAGKTRVRLLKCRGGAQGEVLLDLNRREPATAAAAATPAPAASGNPPILGRPLRGNRRPLPPRHRQIRPLRPVTPQLDLPLSTPAGTPERRPLRGDKPGVLTWLWRK